MGGFGRASAPRRVRPPEKSVPLPLADALHPRGGGVSGVSGNSALAASVAASLNGQHALSVLTPDGYPDTLCSIYMPR